MAVMKKISLHENESLLTYMEGRRDVNTYTTETSRKARRKVNMGKQNAIVLRYIQSRGSMGAADFEGIRDLIQAIPTATNSYRRCRLTLMKAGDIKLAGFYRKSPSGCDCDVWVATGVPHEKESGAGQVPAQTN